MGALAATPSSRRWSRRHSPGHALEHRHVPAVATFAPHTSSSDRALALVRCEPGRGTPALATPRTSVARRLPLGTPAGEAHVGRVVPRSVHARDHSCIRARRARRPGVWSSTFPGVQFVSPWRVFHGVSQGPRHSSLRDVPKPPAPADPGRPVYLRRRGALDSATVALANAPAKLLRMADMVGQHAPRCLECFGIVIAPAPRRFAGRNRCVDQLGGAWPRFAAISPTSSAEQNTRTTETRVHGDRTFCRP